jgi:EpsD family peptidyl-prolyl cis-trans isomerase
LTLSGCDKIKGLMGGKPSGQVVATVNGQEITSLELKSELNGFAARDPKVMKTAQQQALQQIILRRLVVQKAKDEKLDKSPDYTLQLRRGEEGLLTQLYERKIASKVEPPTQRDAENYVASHPDQFANRKIITLDQVVAAPTKVDPQKLASLKTLDEVKALFDANSVPYQESAGELDSLNANPQMIAQILKLPPNDVFVVPQRGAYVFNRISSVRTVPFRGDLATNYATNLLRQQRAQDSVRKQVVALRTAAEPKIVYAAGFKPDKSPVAAAGAPAAAAPAAAPPAK